MGHYAKDCPSKASAKQTQVAVPRATVVAKNTAAPEKGESGEWTEVKGKAKANSAQSFLLEVDDHWDDDSDGTTSLYASDTALLQLYDPF
jgi:hypothetical protein